MGDQYISKGQADQFDGMCPVGQAVAMGGKMRFVLNTISGGFGQKYYLDPVSGSDIQDGMTRDTAFKTLPVAYAALTANKNQILYIIGGSSSLSLAAAFTWEKSYTHLIGLCAGGPYGRARIGHSANFTTLFTVKANGCVFENIHWQMGRGSATNVNCVWVDQTANYNTFIGCHFDAPLHATEAAGAYRSLVLGGTPGSSVGARSNRFSSCMFGDWSIPGSSSTGAVVDFLGWNAGTHFDDCEFYIPTTDATMVALKAAVDMANLYGYVMFNRCRFLATGTAVDVLATAPTSGKLIFADCKAVGVTNWSANSTNVFSANSPALIADGGLGVVIT